MAGSFNDGQGTIVAVAGGDVRATQSFVRVLEECWKRPLLTLYEVLWRWIYGIPALWLLWRVGSRIVASVPLDIHGLEAMTVTQPMKAAQTLAQAMDVLLPPVMAEAKWLGPLLLVTWSVWSALGRTVVLRKIDPSLKARPFTLMVLQAIRVVALLASFGVWFACLQGAARVTVTNPLARGGDPNLVGYFALTIIATIGLFTLWAIVSWGFSVAPLLAMLRDEGPGAALAGAFRLGKLKSKLVEINLVMGIVKIALIVLALVFSSTPLPFESITTPEFLGIWWAADGVLYLAASDFFHVARLLGYLRLWKAYEEH
ncbi:MAG: hypothetical protein PW789_11585 [Edaphobacter sp.]|uniref:hypothetical protein n=1 Tax=Edaphobacter sp. TaxID=1934404 RepID=UPI0023906686|nr:hypothetical protein [Edaphobacter sp.]MDE1177227.1 hypothetical protein [Edaphobacter sp.]